MGDNQIIEMLFKRDEAGISAIERKYGESCLKMAENFDQNERFKEYLRAYEGIITSGAS